MIPLAQEKAEAFTSAVTGDPRWELEDELMCQVFGFTLYGYLLGIGRLICFLDVEDIQELATSALVGLGIGPEYARGMVEYAHEEFMTDGNTSVFANLVGIGHSYFASNAIDALVESVFENTKQLRDEAE